MTTPLETVTFWLQRWRHFGYRFRQSSKVKLHLSYRVLKGPGVSQGEGVFLGNLRIPAGKIGVP